MNLLKDFFPNLRTRIVPNLRGPRLSVWLLYLSHSNRAGDAWPSNALLVAKSGYSLRFVKSAKRELVTGGWLVPTGRFKNRVPVFQVQIPEPVPVTKGAQDTGNVPVTLKQRPSHLLAASRLQKVPTEVIQKPYKEAIHPPGWLAECSAGFYRKTGKYLTCSKSEEAAIDALVKEYGTDAVTRAFTVFLKRCGGFSGVQRPAALFACEFPAIHAGRTTSAVDPCRNLTAEGVEIYRRHGVSI